MNKRILGSNMSASMRYVPLGKYPATTPIPTDFCERKFLNVFPVNCTKKWRYCLSYRRTKIIHSPSGAPQPFDKQKMRSNALCDINMYFTILFGDLAIASNDKFDNFQS